MTDATWLLAGLWIVLLVVSIRWSESPIFKGVSALIGLYLGLVLIVEYIIPSFVILGFNFYWLAMAVIGRKGF